MASLLQFPPVLTGNEGTDEFQRAEALDISRSFIVEAPAGSGKTGLLIQRFLKLLASADVSDPAEVLAITFTRKATHEMRDRVLAQLRRAKAGEAVSSPYDRETTELALAVLRNDEQHGWGLLQHPQQLNIKTIDALSIEIAGSLPVLSGASGLRPVQDSAELYRLAARRTFAHLGGDDQRFSDDLETVLLHRDGHLGNCEKLVADMLQWRDQWTGLIPLTPEALTDAYLDGTTRPQLERALAYAVCRTLTRVSQVIPAPLLSRLTAVAEQLAWADGYKGGVSPILHCRGLHHPPGEEGEHLQHWKALAHLLLTKDPGWRSSLNKNVIGMELTKQQKELLGDLIRDFQGDQAVLDVLCDVANLPPLTYTEEDWRVTKSLFRVLSRALVELRGSFALRSECDFTEFALLAQQALATSGSAEDLGQAAAQPLRHLLVDEMQDTSTTQYELIRLLTRGWSAGGRTVFLVGDPKQSIYLFREARVERFLDTLHTEQLGELRLSALYLTANFRSQAHLVERFNETFTPIFPVVSGEAQPTVIYRPADARRSASLASAAAIEWHVETLPYVSDTEVAAALGRDASQRHALEIREIVERWRARPLPAGRSDPWKIAVLVAARAHLTNIVQAFRAEPEPIPFRAVDIVPLGERQEVLDLLALTRALLHPADRTAWLALLRTPWCGLTLEDLHRLTGNDHPAHAHTTLLELFKERGELLSPDGLSRLEPFWTVLSAALAQRGRMPLSQLVERTWRSFAAPHFLRDEEQTDAARFFRLLDEVEARGAPVTPGALENALSRLFAAPSTRADAVDLMTIHGAKGLEWDVVLVPALERIGGSSESRLLSWLELEHGAGDDDTGMAQGLIAPLQARGEESNALKQWMGRQRTARENAERKRLFYVACTRAREELHLFAAPDRKKEGGLRPEARSLLGAAWSAATEHLRALPDTAGATSGEAPAEPLSLAAEAGAALAWSAGSGSRERVIERIPLPFLPRASSLPRRTLPLLTSGRSGLRNFEKIEGSFEARAFGNAMHAMLESVSKRLATGSTPAGLLAELPAWSPRLAAVLRSQGLAPATLARAVTALERGLTRTLEDPNGRWILSPHPEAANEAALTTAGADGIRLDRMFLAGEEPGSNGRTHLWIVDYKTGTHAPEGLEEFLLREREVYAPQLERYAAQLSQRNLPIQLALYHPVLARLTAWGYVQR